MLLVQGESTLTNGVDFGRGAPSGPICQSRLGVIDPFRHVRDFQVYGRSMAKWQQSDRSAAEACHGAARTRHSVRHSVRSNIEHQHQYGPSFVANPVTLDCCHEQRMRLRRGGGLSVGECIVDSRVLIVSRIFMSSDCVC